MKWLDINFQFSDEISRLNSLAPHEVLKVAADANVVEIKKAYRHLAKVYHPDKSDPFMTRHNEQVMQIVNAAYALLMVQNDGDK